MRKVRNHLGKLQQVQRHSFQRQRTVNTGERQAKILKAVRKLTKKSLRGETHQRLTERGIPRSVNGQKLGLKARLRLVWE